MSAGPYAAAAWDYRRAGWDGVLPLPPKAKEKVPPGYSGDKGAWPSSADIQTWIDFRHPDSNICLRLPKTGLGLDLDAYDGKKGAETLAKLEADLGPLPKTIVSTSRDDGISGIKLYRVPVRPGWRGKAGDNIEIIQFNHRYVIVWPSIHPEAGRVYRWIDERTGEILDHPPRFEDLPELPQAWVDYSSSDTPSPDKADVTAQEADDWFKGLPNGTRCQPVVEKLAAFPAALKSGSRHAAGLDCTQALTRFGALGHHDVRNAVIEARGLFLEAVQADGSGKRVQREAEAEWARLVIGAYGVIKADPTVVPGRKCLCMPKFPRDSTGNGHAGAGQGKTDREPETSTNDDADSGHEGFEDAQQESAGPGDEPRGFPVLSYDELQQLPSVEWTIEGAAQHGEISLIFGQPKGAKSLLGIDMALHVAAGLEWRERVVRQGHVVYVCLENGFALPPRLAAWVDQHPDSLPMVRAHFHAVIARVGATDKDMQKLVDGIDAAIPDRLQLIVIDTVQRFAAGAGLDETARDASLMFDLLDRLKQYYPCAVLLVHHAGKDLSRGARGSNVFSGSPTTILEASKSESNLVQLRCTESNNARDGWSEYWQIAATYEYEEKFGTPYLIPMISVSTDEGARQDDDGDAVHKVVKAVTGTLGINLRNLIIAVGGKREKAEDAIRDALKRGLIVERPGPRGARLFYLPDPVWNV